MDRQRGFTLIELTIVVAIVAILAAIALPRYNDHLARAQLAEAMVLADALKTPLALAYANAPGAGFCVLPATVVTSGRYVATLVLANASASNCDVVVTMRSTNIAAKARGRTVTLNYSPQTAGNPWTCTSDAPIEVKPRPCS